MSWSGATGRSSSAGTFADHDRTGDDEEVWDRVDTGSRFLALGTDHAMVVEVGTYALALRDGRGGGSTFDVRAARWSPERGWYDTYVCGAGADLPLAADASTRAGWHVIESG